MPPIDFTPVFLSLKLASLTTVLLIIICLPFAWYVTHTRKAFRSLLAAFSALPLVLPPTVLGFYLLLLLGANGPLNHLNLPTLAFTFPGLVIGSMVYSFPFAFQPIYNAFERIGKGPLEAAAVLGASPTDRFLTITLPLAKPGILTAAALTFAHTLGEFGVILMIGGNIPGETQVLSVAIYEHVEALEYQQAFILSGGMMLFSFILLFALHYLQKTHYKNYIPPTHNKA